MVLKEFRITHSTLIELLRPIWRAFMRLFRANPFWIG